MKLHHHSIFLISVLLSAASAVPDSAIAQQTNNASNLTNQAAPSASANTTGGTNINYQTNNTYQNEVGFGPGVFAEHRLFTSVVMQTITNLMLLMPSQKVATLPITMP